MAETVKNIAVLEKALHIMEFLLAYPKGVQLNEISIGVGLNKSTVYRILHTLRLHNYVIQDEKDSSYSLGNRFLLYSPFIQSLSINNVALPFMQEFSDRYDFSTSLATLDKDTSLTLSSVNPTRPSSIRISAEVGFRCPLYCCASGKVILSTFSPQALDEYLDSHHLTPLTEHTITNVLALRKDLALTAQRGYSIEYRENENEIISIGVPIYNSNGELLAAMTFITLASLFDMETLPEISGALIKQASKVSSALCCRYYKSAASLCIFIVFFPIKKVPIRFRSPSSSSLLIFSRRSERMGTQSGIGSKLNIPRQNPIL